MLLNTANLSALFTGFKAAYQGAFAAANNTWDQVATLVPSSTETNLYGFLGQFPNLREWIGDRQIKNMEAFNYSITNKQFESTIAVPRPKIMDDTYGVFSTLVAEMGYAAKMHPDSIVYAMLAAGATTLCYDGQYFFDTDHPVTVAGAASTKSNYDATGGGNLWCLMDTRRPIKPLIFQKREDYNFQAFTSMADEHVFKRNEYLYGVDARVNAGFGLWQLAYGSLNTLNSTNVESYVTTMMGLKSNEDKPLGIMPNLCVVGPSNWSAARSVFEVPYLASGATNPNFQLCKVLVSPFLT